KYKPGRGFVDRIQAAHYRVRLLEGIEGLSREDSTASVSTTRSLLHDAFHKRFFSRYTDRQEIIKCSFVLEMQLFLHPNFTSFDGFLKRIVYLCNTHENGAVTAAGERHFFKIKKIIYNNVRAVMLSVVTMQETRTSASQGEKLIFVHGCMTFHTTTEF
ncbi:hypothetical protein JG688_00010757, partial [Phytophthora aleatoria]